MARRDVRCIVRLADIANIIQNIDQILSEKSTICMNWWYYLLTGTKWNIWLCVIRAAISISRLFCSLIFALSRHSFPIIIRLAISNVNNSFKQTNLLFKSVVFTWIFGGIYLFIRRVCRLNDYIFMKCINYDKIIDSINKSALNSSQLSVIRWFNVTTRFYCQGILFEKWRMIKLDKNNVDSKWWFYRFHPSTTRQIDVNE